MAQKALDIVLHAVGMVEQPLCGLEHSVRSRESRVGMAFNSTMSSATDRELSAAD
jgi:hypothetical protein